MTIFDSYGTHLNINSVWFKKRMIDNDLLNDKIVDANYVFIFVVRIQWISFFVWLLLLLNIKLKTRAKTL